MACHNPTEVGICQWWTINERGGILSPAYSQWEFPTIDEIGYFGQHRFVKVWNKFSYDDADGKLHHQDKFCFTEGLFHHTRERDFFRIVLLIFLEGLFHHTRERKVMEWQLQKRDLRHKRWRTWILWWTRWSSLNLFHCAGADADIGSVHVLMLIVILWRCWCWYW